MQKLSEQEDLIVWMRTAALPTFRKLYGRIEVDLEANDVVIVTIENNYNTYSFGGNKKLVLSTASWIGGKNYLLGIAYLTVGGLCLFLAISFILLYLIKPRYVNWFISLQHYDQLKFWFAFQRSDCTIKTIIGKRLLSLNYVSA